MDCQIKIQKDFQKKQIFNLKTMKLNKNTKSFITISATLTVTVFALFSIVYIAFANQPFTTILEAEKNILIEEQHEIKKKGDFWREKLEKESSKLEEQQRKVNDIKARINSLSSDHDQNTGRIDQITRTLEVYKGL